jgi:hypothetical protein
MVPVLLAPQAKGAPPMGTTIPTASQAASVFDAVCVDTLPDFADAPRVLRKLGMSMDKSTGVFINPKFDLSIALVKSGDTTNCSMVFATTGHGKKTANRVASGAVKKGKHLKISVLERTAQRTLLNAQIPAQ